MFDVIVLGGLAWGAVLYRPVTYAIETVHETRQYLGLRRRRHSRGIDSKVFVQQMKLERIVRERLEWEEAQRQAAALRLSDAGSGEAKQGAERLAGSPPDQTVRLPAVRGGSRTHLTLLGLDGRHRR